MYKVISIRFFYSFLLFFIGICSACSSYRTLEVEILSPAKITLEREGKIGFLDRQISRAADTTFVLYSYQGISPAELSFLFFPVFRMPIEIYRKEILFRNFWLKPELIYRPGILYLVL